MCGCGRAHKHGSNPEGCSCCFIALDCDVCARLAQKVSDLEAQNKLLSDALRGQLSRPSNTDMILGAALSGGDALKLAETLTRKG